MTGTLQPQPSYFLSRWLFLRLLGLVYLVAFVSLAVQVVGLVGRNGVQPTSVMFDRARAAYGTMAYRLLPSIFWLCPGDACLRVAAWGGAALAGGVILGLAPVPLLVLLWALYLSFSIAGQVFLSFQWDALLLETGLLAVLYAPGGWRPRLASESPPPGVIRWLLWLLLLKLLFLSGVTKLASGDPTWRGLTALAFHYGTQPLPTPLSWYMHQLPLKFQELSALVMFVAEIVLPFSILVPPRLQAVRSAGAAGVILFQLAIAATGNYAFFNLLTIVLCLPLLDDGVLWRLLPRSLGRAAASTNRPQERWWKQRVHMVAGGFILVLSVLVFVQEIRNTLPGGRMREPGLSDAVLAAAEPFRSINGYGLFRVMTTERPEIVIEGSEDGRQWLEYQFRWKPGDVQRRPTWVAPYQPRLDWQMWFAGLNPRENLPWLGMLLRRLVEGSPEVLALLDRNPFSAPPRYVRLAYYRYRFTSAEGRRATGAWWEREFIAYLTPPLTLDQLR